MMQETLLKVLRKVYRAVVRPDFTGNPWPKDDEWESTNTLLANLFSSERPCFVGRVGTVENAVVVNYITVHSCASYFRKCLNYITDNTRLPFYDAGKPFLQLQSNAGFFPTTEENLARFCEMMLEDVKEVDILESWLHGERALSSHLTCELVTAEVMGPYFLHNPWTRALKGKKVLVVHPFAKSIERQYQKREYLFTNPDVLPEFELKTIKAVQSIGGNTAYKDWFGALESMKTEINNTDFDICIIGCGAYGFPLAAHVKRIGKRAIHLAGMTQLLFGIWGARWDKDNYSKYDYKALLNEHWVRPAANEKPDNAGKVESGCYW